MYKSKFNSFLERERNMSMTTCIFVTQLELPCVTFGERNDIIIVYFTSCIKIIFLGTREFRKS